MKLPKKIYLLDGEYEIKLVKGKKLVYRDGYDKSENGWSDGRIYHDKQLILINKNLKINEQIDVLWHEIVHHALNFLNIRGDEGTAQTISNLIVNVQEQLK